MSLKKKGEDMNEVREEDGNEDKDDDKTGAKDDEETNEKDDGKEEDSNKDRDDEETEEKDDGNAAPQTYFLQGRHINLNMRPINFLELSTHVIHQINDGPCALIAVCK